MNNGRTIDFSRASSTAGATSAGCPLGPSSQTAISVRMAPGITVSGAEHVLADVIEVLMHLAPRTNGVTPPDGVNNTHMFVEMPVLQLVRESLAFELSPCCAEANGADHRVHG